MSRIYRVIAFDAHDRPLFINGRDLDGVQWREFDNPRDALAYVRTAPASAYAFDIDNIRWTRRAVAYVHLYTVIDGTPNRNVEEYRRGEHTGMIRY